MNKPKSKSQLLMGLFLLGCALFNYPILTLFNRRTTLFGIPLLYLYLFIIWAIIIVAIMLITKARTKTTSSKRHRADTSANALDRLR
jgi:TRAP-type C4-dicarboxylate transport system permease small subunit